MRVHQTRLQAATVRSGRHATAAAKADYTPWDLTGNKHPLLTSKANDQTGKQWDKKGEAGVRYAEGITNVEYFRDVKPILERSCVACHNGKAEPAY